MKSRIIHLFLLSILTHQSAQANPHDGGYSELVKKVIPGVVNISTFAKPKPMRGAYPGGLPQDEMMRRFYEDFFGGPMGGPRMGPSPFNGPRHAPKSGKAQQIALGTGFIIDANEGLILTNNHVIEGADEVKVQLREEDAELIPASIIGKDPELDVALLKVKSKNLKSIPMGNSDLAEVGDVVLAMGNPLGYGHTVSKGIVSAKGRRNPEFRMGKYIQTDASINPGNSGGPLVNVDGEVIGINNAIDARAQGIGFAIPINLIKAVLPQLKTKGSVSRGYIGVSAADMSPEIAEEFGLNPKLKGVFIPEVAKDQPAAKAGIKSKDVITAINDEKVENAQDLTTKVTSLPVGAKVKITYIRDGVEKSTQAVIAERPIQK